MYNPISSEADYGLGYLIVPQNKNRDEYIQECYNTNSICIMTEMSGVFQNVRVGKGDFGLLNFPLNSEAGLGTAIFWLREPMYHQVYAMKILSKDPYTEFDSSGQSVGNMDSGNLSNSAYSAKNGSVVTTVNHDEKAFHQTSLNSPNKSALHVTEVTGSIEQKADYINNEARESIDNVVSNFDTYETSSIGITSNQIDIKSEKVVLGADNQPMVLGNQFFFFMFDFIKKLSEISVNTPFGQMPILNKEEIEKLQELRLAMLSQTCFLSD